MASGGGGCSASERLPPPFPGLEPESEEGAAGGSDPEAGDSDTEGEDIFTGAAAAVSSQPLGAARGRTGAPNERKAGQSGPGETLLR